MEVAIYSCSEGIWGGSQTYIESLCIHLNASDISTAVVSSDSDRFSCPILTIPSQSHKGLRLLGAPALAHKLRRAKSKVVILDDLSSLWLAPIFRLYGFKVISLLHLELKPISPQGFGHSSFERKVLQLCSFFAHEMLSVGRKNLEVFPREVKFVGNFVPNWFFEVPPVQPRLYDAGFISRFAPEKNLPLFLDLAAAMRDVIGNSFRAIMVGAGPEEKSIKRRIYSLGLEKHITVKGWTERLVLPQVYRSLNCLVVTSFHEGFPTTVLEAHAQGVPVVSVSTAGYVPEFVVGNLPVTGLVFDSRLSGLHALAARISSLRSEITELEVKCIEKARHFSESQVLGGIEKIVSSLLRG